MSGALQHFSRGADVGAGRFEIGVGDRGRSPGPRFDRDVGAERDELLHRLRRRGDARFARAASLRTAIFMQRQLAD